MNVTIMIVKVTVSYFGNINGNFCILHSNYLSGQSNNEVKNDAKDISRYFIQLILKMDKIKKATVIFTGALVTLYILESTAVVCSFSV